MFWPNSRNIQAILADVQAILALLRRPRPTRIALELPAISSKKGVKMANFELKNDQVATITLKTTNAEGQVEPYPSGLVFTAQSSNAASLGVAIGQDASGNPALILTPLVQQSPNLSVIVNGNDGLASVTQIVDIVEDNTPTNTILDLADATFTVQPVPANPGP